MARRRPNPIQWLWYAAGGRLPSEFRQWVLRGALPRGDRMNGAG
nr:DUF5313 family protein [Saccharomonospora piscinae]